MVKFSKKKLKEKEANSLGTLVFEKFYQLIFPSVLLESTPAHVAVVFWTEMKLFIQYLCFISVFGTVKLESDKVINSLALFHSS